MLTVLRITLMVLLNPDLILGIGHSSATSIDIGIRD